MLGQSLYKGVEPRAAEHSDLSLEQDQSLEAFEPDDLGSDLVSDFFESPFLSEELLSEELLSEELSEEEDSDFLSADSPDFLDGER